MTYVAFITLFGSITMLSDAICFAAMFINWSYDYAAL